MLSITPIEWEGLECLYVLQYQEGYEIISADKRSPIPIAYNDQGNFDFSEDSEVFLEHLNLLAEEIWFSLNGYGDNPGPEAWEMIESSLDFWRMVNADNDYIISMNEHTKGEPQLPLGRFVGVLKCHYIRPYRVSGDGIGR